MGYNTTVVLFNDQISDWPDEIHRASQIWRRHDLRDKDRFCGWFGYGEVVAVEHASHSQVCVIGGNCGRYLTAVTPVEMEADLEALAQVLQAHGYGVRGPGEKRVRPSLRWGYQAGLKSHPLPPAPEVEG